MLRAGKRSICAKRGKRSSCDKLAKHVNGVHREKRYWIKYQCCTMDQALKRTQNYLESKSKSNVNKM